MLEKYSVIVCDDGSTDKSFEIITECFKEIHNVTLIQNKFNTRKVGAISKMVELVNTPFVFTLDADSILSELEKDAIEKLMSRMSGIRDVSD